MRILFLDKYRASLLESVLRDITIVERCLANHDNLYYINLGSELCNLRVNGYAYRVFVKMANTTLPLSTTHSAFPLSSLEELTSPWALIALVGGLYMLSSIFAQIFGYKYPIFGISSQLEPIVVSNFRFFRRAEDILNEGYQAVSLITAGNTCNGTN